MDRKKVFVGVFVILVIAGVIWGFKKAKAPKGLQVPPASEETTKKIEDAFKLKIPEDLDRAELSQAGAIEGLGIATRKFENGRFTLTILADLPDPQRGSYQAQLVNGDGEKVNLGSLRLAKGGYLLDFSSLTDYSDYPKVIVLLNGEKVLEGAF